MTGGALRPSFGLCRFTHFALTVCDSAPAGLLTLITLFLSPCPLKTICSFGKASLSPDPPFHPGHAKSSGGGGQKGKRSHLHKQTPTHTVTRTHSHTQSKHATTPPLLSAHCNNFGWTGQRVGRLRWNTRKRRGSV